PWLRQAVHGIETELREQAIRDACDLAEELDRMRRRCPGQAIALDVGGRVVAARDPAEGRGSAGLDLATDCPPLAEFVLEGIARARADHAWVGFAEAVIPGAGDVIPVTIRPVVRRNRVIGMLGTLGESAGEQLDARAPATGCLGAPL